MSEGGQPLGEARHPIAAQLEHAPAEGASRWTKDSLLEEIQLVRTRDHILKSILARGLQRSDAEDIAQVVMLDAYRAIEEDKFDYHRELRPWLETVIWNAICDHFKTHRRFSTHLPLDTHTQHLSTGNRDPEQQILQTEMHEQMFRLIDQLPKELQSVLIAHVDGRIQKEIAASLGMTQGAIAKRLARAERLLHKLWNNYRNEIKSV